MESSKKSNKIRDVVRLQQVLKKWKKLAVVPKSSSSSSNASSSGGNRSMRFLKKTLSFSESSVLPVATDVVPKGFLAVCVGEELKRFIIPTEYLSHPAFGMLLREAEEEFGFEQEGVLKIPCQVSVFEMVLKVVEEKSDVHYENEYGFSCYSPDCDLSSHHPQMCR